MRTTVTLDADVAAQLHQAMKLHGASFKEALNSAVRAGLPALPKAAPKSRKPYVLKPRDLGMRTDLLPSRFLQALDVAKLSLCQ